MNNWILTGRLGKDAETKALQSGTTVVKMSVATDETRKGEKTTLWTEISWFNGNEKLVPYLKKGAVIMAEGRPAARHYTNKANEVVDLCDMVANRIEILAFASANNAATAEPANALPKEQDAPF